MTAVETDVITEVRDYLNARSEKTEHMAFHFGDAKFFSPTPEHQADGLILGGENLPMTSGAFRQLSEVLNVPVPYAQRIPDDLLDRLRAIVS